MHGRQVTLQVMARPLLIYKARRVSGIQSTICLLYVVALVPDLHRPHQNRALPNHGARRLPSHRAVPARRGRAC